MNNSTSSRISVRDQRAVPFRAFFIAAALLSFTTPLRADTGPAITTQPQSPQNNILVCTGFTISVTADGIPPLAYQWARNGAFLQGATNSSLTISNIEFSDAGVYVVRVSNIVDSLWSDPALLLFYPPTIITQPASEISPTGASLNSLITPDSTNAVVSFNWGTDTSYGNSTAGIDVENGLAPRDSKQALSGLNPNTLYHYQAVASSAFGTALPSEFTLTITKMKCLLSAVAPLSCLLAVNPAFAQNWTATSAPNMAWSSVASSADGATIYSSQTTSPPTLAIAPSGTTALLSWTIPSMAFTLQQNYDLTTTNWTDVTTAPLLNLSKLQNQVLVVPTIGHTFYRLRH